MTRTEISIGGSRTTTWDYSTSWYSAVLEATYKEAKSNDSPDLLLLSIQWPTDRSGLPASLTSSASQAPRRKIPKQVRGITYLCLP